MYLSNICYIIKQKKKRGILMIFKWMNESAISIEGDRIEITAPPRTDFFCGSIDECEEGIFMHMACLSYHLSTISYLSYVRESHCLIMRQRIFRIHYFRWDVRHRQDRSSQSLSVLAY